MIPSSVPSKGIVCFKGYGWGLSAGLPKKYVLQGLYTFFQEINIF
jgi:hypothetical protein